MELRDNHWTIKKLPTGKIKDGDYIFTTYLDKNKDKDNKKNNKQDDTTSQSSDTKTKT
jgi:hypothetical protein